jgi:hypothetical protein
MPLFGGTPQLRVERACERVHRHELENDMAEDPLPPLRDGFIGLGRKSVAKRVKQGFLSGVNCVYYSIYKRNIRLSPYITPALLCQGENRPPVFSESPWACRDNAQNNANTFVGAVKERGKKLIFHLTKAGGGGQNDNKGGGEGEWAQASKTSEHVVVFHWCRLVCIRGCMERLRLNHELTRMDTN